MTSLKLNVFSRSNVLNLLKNIVSEQRSAYSIDKETIGSILITEYCPLLTTFWQNLLNYIIFDVSFEQNQEIPNIIMRYKKEDIDISIRASTKDCIAIQIFYQGKRITEIRNLDSTIIIEISSIIRELTDLIMAIIPDKPLDTNVLLCSVVDCA
jgi:hypothetical protein